MTSQTPKPTGSNYRIVSRSSADELEGAVQFMIGIGWRPLGGLCVRLLADGSSGAEFLQAMSREDVR